MQYILTYKVNPLTYDEQGWIAKTDWIPDKRTLHIVGGGGVSWELNREDE